MVDLHFADYSELKKAGRNFDCGKCTDVVKKLRRCKEDREDFTMEDGNVWPMYVNKGGTLYNFCPAKATWDQGLVSIFNNLEITALTGQLLYPGALGDQPEWYADLLHVFLTKYDTMKWNSRMKSIFGDGGGAKKSGQGIKNTKPSRARPTKRR